MKTAADIMTRDVTTVTRDLSVKELAKLLTSKNISGVPVVDESGSLIGVVTESDLIYQNKKIHIPTAFAILDAFIFLESTEKMDREMRKIAGSTVGDIYTEEVVRISESARLDEIATIMSERNVHTLPVVSGGKLVGVIGKRDIIKTIIS